MKYKILRLLLFAALIAGGLVTVFPFVWMVLSSFKSNGEIEALNQTLLPQVPVLENYLNLQNNFNFYNSFFNSVFHRRGSYPSGNLYQLSVRLCAGEI